MFNEISDKTLIVHLDREIDHHYSEKIREKIDSDIKTNGINKLIFDFSKVKFTDSSAIGVVMGRYKLISNMGGKVSLFGLNPPTEKIFKMSGMDKLVKMCKTKKEAEKE